MSWWPWGNDNKEVINRLDRIQCALNVLITDVNEMQKSINQLERRVMATYQETRDLLDEVMTGVRAGNAKADELIAKVNAIPAGGIITQAQLDELADGLRQTKVELDEQAVQNAGGLDDDPNT